jgi:hypothetical protein
LTFEALSLLRWRPIATDGAAPWGLIGDIEVRALLKLSGVIAAISNAQVDSGGSLLMLLAAVSPGDEKFQFG